MSHDIELSILMPCLNEADTLATRIRKARRFLENDAIVGEVLYWSRTMAARTDRKRLHERKVRASLMSPGEATAQR